MNFTFTEEQLLIKETADRFFRDNYPLETWRRHQTLPGGFCRQAWAQYAELGWLALGVPEEFGGIGGGAADQAILMECFGRGLVIEPYLSTMVLGAGLLLAGASDDLKADVLPQIVEGQTMMSVAYAEAKSRFDLGHVECQATRDGDAYVLTGEKIAALHAGSADLIAVTARTAGGDRDRDGITVFLVGADAPGLTIRDYPTVDGLRAANLAMERVAVPAERILGTVDHGLALLDRTVDRATAMVAAEAAGLMAALTEQTVAYLKDRKQFGKALGDFQALQHRATEMYMETELTRSLAYMAAVEADQSDPATLARAVSQAKVKVGRAGRMIGQEAVQLHGGMGVTDEMPVGHYFKRLTMIDHTFGDAAHHLERLASLP